MQSSLFFYLFHSTSRLGVPLFLFLSGALLLKKDFKDSAVIKHFYKHNLLGLVITIEIWYVCYYLLDVFIFRKIILLKDFLPILFFLKKHPLDHAWYLPMIVWMYVAVPFVGIIAKKYGKILKPVLIVSCLYLFLIPMINTILKLLNVDYQIPNAFEMPFSGGYYGTYLLVGYYISKNKSKIKKKMNSFLLIVILALSLGITVFIRYKLHCGSWYDMLTIFISSVCLYLLLLKVKTRMFRKGLMSLSVLSFGVYLIHKPIIDLLGKSNIVNASGAKMPIQVILYFVFAVGISYVAVWLISKIRLLKRYLLFVR